MKKLFKFGIVGIINTLMTMTIYNILIYFNVNYIIANTLGYIAGTINSYLWNNNWVFNKKSKEFRTFAKFLVVNIISFLINTTVLYLLVSNLNVNKRLAQLAAITVSMCVNYILNRNWTFKMGRVEY